MTIPSTSVRIRGSHGSYPSATRGAQRTSRRHPTGVEARPAAYGEGPCPQAGCFSQWHPPSSEGARGRIADRLRSRAARAGGADLRLPPERRGRGPVPPRLRGNPDSRAGPRSRKGRSPGRGRAARRPLSRTDPQAPARARGRHRGGAGGCGRPPDESARLHGRMAGDGRHVPALRAQLRDPRRGGALPRGVRSRTAVSARRARDRRRAAHPYHERLQRLRVRRQRRRRAAPGVRMSSGIEAQVLQPYKYGFVTDIEADVVPPGLSEDVIRLISAKKGEPEWMLEWRLRAYRNWLKMPEPHWANVRYGPIDYQAISYYAAPKKRPQLESLEQVDPKLLETFEKLGLPLEERKRLAGVAVDAVFDSVSVATTFRETLAQQGIIFCAISEAIREHPELVREYVGSVVPYNDNFFAALNSAVFTDGSFAYIPKGVRCPLELSTYFRINTSATGQFERTLIVAEEGSSVSYLEGCSAPIRDEHQLHAAVVELVALDNATIKYSTIQNWYPGDEAGRGGIYNFVTKRGKCLGKNSKISWTQVETGSAITWKYPGCILQGDNSIGEFYSVAVTNNRQQADTGTKMIHLGKNTRSTIVSKGISAGHGQNTYRGLVKILKGAEGARNYSQCDSMLIGDQCGAHTFPYIDVRNSTAIMEHEASTSKIGEDQIFYCKQRGLAVEDAISMIVNGFCKEVFKELPMEFAVEAQRLLGISLEGSVG